jgi:hypothetical protein
LTPKGTLRIACPPSVPRATYARLIREYNRLLANFDGSPQRRLASRLRTAYQRQNSTTSGPATARALAETGAFT